jgi:hypothetical protein
LMDGVISQNAARGPQPWRIQCTWAALVVVGQGLRVALQASKTVVSAPLSFKWIHSPKSSIWFIC